MSVCESCGANFDPATLPATMTSSRILCRPCYDKRQAEKYAAKAKQVATAGAAAPTAAAPARPAPAPQPSKPPAPAAAKPPAPVASKPPVSVASKPPSAPTAAAHAHAGPSHAAPAHADHSHGNHSHGDHPHAEGAHKPGSASSFSRHGPKKTVHEPVDVKAALRAESTAVMDKTTKKGLVYAMIFLLVGVGAVTYSVTTRNSDAVKAKEAEKKLSDFLARVKAEDITTVDGANGVLKITDISKDVWVDTPITNDINTLRTKAGITLQADADKRTFFDRLTALEGQSKDVATKTAEELRRMRKTADSLALEAQGFGADAVGRIGVLRGSLQSLIGTKLKEEAIAYADGPGKSDPREALQKLGAAEDDVRSMWETMYKENNAQGKTLFAEYLKELIARSDKLANEYFTDAVIEQVPPRDLLVGDLASEWVFKGVKGSTAKIVAGQLILTGGEADSKGRALNVIGDKEQWRDFVITGEFTVETGNFTLAFRLGQNLDRNSEIVDVHTDEGKIAPGGTYSFTYKLTGSTVKMTWKDNVLEPTELDLLFSAPRHGAFAVVVDKGTKVIFKHLSIRELR